MNKCIDILGSSVFAESYLTSNHLESKLFKEQIIK